MGFATYACDGEQERVAFRPQGPLPHVFNVLLLPALAPRPHALPSDNHLRLA
jgi:hypothetical protein